MRIQHNIMAMTAYRNYNTNTSALSKNLEKLSSGYKINRAGDDAAGLAISEKMRAQITGLNAAQKNVKDGISLVKTGEGAMQEIQDMLNRMDYLATQSANGTYDNDVDRKNLQKEVDALKSEINRIADSANFNGIKLLDGSLAGSSATMATSSTSLVTESHLQLHEAGVEEQSPSFDIDISQIFDGLKANASLAAGSTFSIKVEVGGTTVTITASAIGSIANGALITASKVNLSLGSATSATVSGHDFDINMTSGKISFTFKASASNNTAGVPDFQSSMDVKVTASGAGLGSKYYVDCKTQNVQDGIAKVADQMAHTQFKVTATMVNSMIDGTSKLVIGDQTFTVAADKKVSQSSGTEIGVKDLLGADGKIDATKLNQVADAITRLASTGNNVFHVGAGADNVIDLHEKATYYDGTDETLLNSAEKLGKLVNMTTGGGKGTSLTLQIGDTSDAYNQLSVTIGDMHTAALKIDGIDISNQTGAQSAIQTIRDAINTVSSVRGDLGATQNRLEHTANNLSVMAENIQDAESTIRDTDVAEEMMAYTKNNILIQSAQAMLAQANAVPQGVLQLLG